MEDSRLIKDLDGHLYEEVSLFGPYGNIIYSFKHKMKFIGFVSEEDRIYSIKIFGYRLAPFLEKKWEFPKEYGGEC